MNMLLVSKGYSIPDSEFSVIDQEWKELDAVGKRYGKTPAEIDKLLDDLEINKALIMISVEREAERSAYKNIGV